ncbi:hypothetical protein HELRODRAFT_189501 [Helobdella robusta]|uniref:WD repeat domain phosphoinositide-interacting protein 2 n=1 Tax=Helobdella robusta TaxID=6412 RepID=T1FR39_HELRO|nr:hypothetical protein HELRODRAFT_189501 [Helobdella robusta]ESN92555.1 hypothetical protein HELRODRAFT_189501 [Helobdella robusta]
MDCNGQIVYRSLLTGRNGDYNIYTLANISKSLPLLYTFPSNDEVILVERLLSTSLIVFVTASQPSRLVLHHFRNQKECFVVCLEDSISIHSIRDLRTLHVIRDVPLNTHITCTLSPNSPTNCFVAYPASNHSGEVAIFDAENLRPVWSIDAHDTVIAAMAFSYDGLLLATASVKGTVIRVFSVASRSKVFEFRRSMKRCATVYSLAFSKDGKFLCCSSSTETVHIFKIDLQKLNAMNQEVPSNENQGWMDYLGQAIKSSTTYLPAQVTEVLSQERGFAVARLPSSCSSFTATATASLSSSPANTAAVASSPTAAAACSAAVAGGGGRNVCGITSIEGGTYVMIVQQNAEMLVYNVDVVNGGECNIVAQYSLNISGIPFHHHHHLPPPPPPLHHHHQPPVPRSVQPPPSSSVPSSLSSSTQEQPSPAPPSSSSSSSIDQDTTPTDCHSPLNDLEWMKVKKLPRANTSPQWSPCRRSYASVVNSQDSGDMRGDGACRNVRGDGACRDGSGCCRSGDCSPIEVASPSTSSSSGSSSSSASSSSLASSSLQPPSQIRSDLQPPQRLQPTKQQQQQLQPKKQPQQPQNIYYQQHQNQMLKFEGELVLRDAIVSIEDLYMDAECGWLEDSSEFPSIIKKK